MFRIFILLIFYFLDLYPFEKPIAHETERLIPSVVKVKIQRNDNAIEENELIQSDSGGSGFVFDDEHRILTNEHVIKDAKKIFIIDHTNTEYIATLVGKDEKSDIAVLSVEGFNTPKLPISKEANISTGDNVFVIGAPYSLGSSVTVGVISATNRVLQNYPYQHFIQTDAAINPGNSGGPMFNQDGEVIAIATMTFARSGNYTNIGFAIPIQKALTIASTLIEYQKVERGYLGADLLISDKISRKLGYNYSTLITSIEPNSPASNAALRSGDIIIGVNNQRFNDHGLLHRTLFSSRPNDSLSLTYVRDKKSFTTHVILGNAPIKEKLINNLGSGDKAEKTGLIVEESSKSLRVICTHGMAKSVGVADDDLILSLNNLSCSTIKELNKELTKLGDSGIGLLKLQRNKETIFLPIGSKTALQGYTTSN